MPTSESSARSLLAALNVEHPEWAPLLAVVDQALREAERPAWARFVPALRHPGDCGRPLLDGAVVTVAPSVVGRWVRRLLEVAAAGDSNVEALTTMDPLVLFEIALSQDVHRFGELGDLVQGLAPLIAMPLLQACRRHWVQRVPPGWAAGYCPICGGSAAIGEIRGLDGGRRLRCRGCGGDWATQWLRCPFCGEADHDKLGSLMSADSLERLSVDVCDGCGSYVKMLRTLTAISPEQVVVQDLATLVLDVAAAERGYRRHATNGRGVAVNVVAEPSWLRERLGLLP
jgi:Protein involved in formate dehydrogenase formation